MQNETLVTLTADIVSAHVSANQVDEAGVVALIEGVHKALSELGETAKEEAVTRTATASYVAYALEWTGAPSKRGGARTPERI